MICFEDILPYYLDVMKLADQLNLRSLVPDLGKKLGKVTFCPDWSSIIQKYDSNKHIPSESILLSELKLQFQISLT